MPERSFLRRRDVIKAAGAALAAGAGAARAVQPPGAKPVLCLFSKPLGGRQVADLPPVLHEAGVNAVDLTCRPGGHVLPERVADDLPRAIEQLSAAGIAVPMITTAITDATQGHAEAIVQAASALGIRYAKLGYYSYRESEPVLKVLAEARARLRDLAGLFRQHGVVAGYHNHSGMYVGAPVWDLWQLIQDLPAEAIGSFFDLGHATVEGGDGGWRINLDLILPRLVMLAVKDMKWQKGARGFSPAWGPLGEGMVEWAPAFERIRKAGFAGPVSLHVEYGGHDHKPGSDRETAVLSSIRRDWMFLRDRLSAARLL